MGGDGVGPGGGRGGCGVDEETVVVAKSRVMGAVPASDPSPGIFSLSAVGESQRVVAPIS